MIHPTYKANLELTYENQISSAGLCLCYANLERLKEKQEFFLHPKELVYFRNLIYPKRQLNYLLGGIRLNRPFQFF